MRYSPFRHLPAALLHRRPLFLTLFVTRRCNAACPFCFYLRDPLLQERPAAMAMDLAAYRRLADQTRDLLWLALSGGEVFLDPRLVEIVTLFYQRSRPAFILLPTNGLDTDAICDQTEAILQRCPKSTVTVKLSLDGPAAVHDRLRNVPGAHDRVWRSFAGLQRLAGRYANLELGFNSVLCRATLATMTATRRLVAQRAPKVSHTLSLARGAPADDPAVAVRAGDYHRIATAWEEIGRPGRYRFLGGGLKAAQDRVQRRRIHQTMVRRCRWYPCPAGHLSLVVDVDGTAYPCESFHLALGNLADHQWDPARLLATAQARRVRRRIQDRSCYCTHECYQMLGLFTSPRYWPAILAAYLTGGRRRQQKKNRGFRPVAGIG